VRAWALEILCLNSEKYGSALTAMMMPADHDADRLRDIIPEHFDMSLGMELAKLSGKVFRIGHPGDLIDPTLMGSLSSVEMGPELAAVPHRIDGANAAMIYLAHRAMAKTTQKQAA
jgi:alanine-glyoxylate transaminase/serine-glyoxylate transaminase/serine-pyruvate transaminase